MSEFTGRRQFSCYYIPLLFCWKELVYENCYHPTQRVIFIRLQALMLEIFLKFFFSTPFFVLTEISSSPCRNARTHSLKTSQLHKLTFAKTFNIHNTIKHH